MMKCLLFSLVLLFSVSAKAQVSISIDPGVITGIGPAIWTDIGTHAQIINTSADTIELLWSRTVQSIEDEWTTWICDLNNCYLPNIAECPTSRPNVLAPGTALNFEVHIGPAGVEGTASILIEFYTLQDPSTIIGTLQSHFETGTSAVDDLGASALRIFPNPTTTYFQLSDPAQVSTVAIYTMVGNKVREFNAGQDNRFEVADLPVGIYLVRLLDNRSSVLKTVRLSKR